VKLSTLQWLVLFAIVAMFATAVLDVVNVIAPPNWVWIVVPLALWAASQAVLPRMAELRQASRRGGSGR
jgi:hypothetical protein